jgi:DNA primase
MEIRTIKSIPILDVAERLGLKIRGRSTHCFAHQPDRNPSLHFNIEKNTFRCYVCPQIGGSVIDLVMLVLNLPFHEALKYLSARSRTERPERAPHSMGGIGTDRPEKRVAPGEKNEILQSFLSETSLEKEGVRYLTERGIDIETARKMGVGFLRPEDYRNLFWRMSRRFGCGQLKTAGLTRFYLFAKEGLSFLLFPYRMEGRVNAIKGRCLLTKAEAKERGVSRFVMTERARIFYNQEIIKSTRDLYLCEGEIDTLTLLQAGYPAVGIPGTGSIGESQLDLLGGKRVVLCLDPDRAGKEAAAYLSGEFDKRGIANLKLDLPDGKDVNECYLAKERVPKGPSLWGKKEGSVAQR